MRISIKNFTTSLVGMNKERPLTTRYYAPRLCQHAVAFIEQKKEGDMGNNPRGCHLVQAYHEEV